MRRPHKILRVTGGRVAYTNTSRVPDAELVKALRWLAKHVDLDRVVVHMKSYNGGRNYGRAYSYLPGMASTEGLRRGEWRYLVIVRDTTCWFNTLAHEAKHVEQYRERTIRKAKEMRRCEYRARAFAEGMTRRYAEA